MEIGAAIEIELATKEDIVKINRNIQKIREQYEPDWLTANGKTDDDGFLNLLCIKGIVGKRLVIGRLVLLADGYTPAVPFTATDFWWGFYRGTTESTGALFDFPIGTFSLPNIAEYSGRNAPTLKPQEDLWLGMYEGPSNTNIVVNAQLWYEKIWTERE